MKLHRLTTRLCCVVFLLALSACDTGSNSPSPQSTGDVPTATAPPTPSAEILQVRSIATEGTQLRVTLPSIKLLNHDPRQDVQLFLVLADPAGVYTYLLNPANQRGVRSGQFDLSAYPVDISVASATERVVLWILVVHNIQYRPAEMFGLDALAASLAIGFRNWIAEGDPTDDPLAAIVSASNGALYDWFANINVLGQELITFRPGDNGEWPAGLNSRQSADAQLNTVYDVQIIPGEQTALPPTPTVSPEPEERLIVNETFPGGRSTHNWFEGQDNTYRNHLTNGAYEIQLTAIEQGESGLSWGSMEGERFQNYRLEASVRLVEEEVIDGRYGIWFHYQDDYNFIYFGIRNTGEYRVAIIQRNSNRIEVQDWTPHQAIIPGAATNTLSIRAAADGNIILGINGKEVKRFTDSTFTSGSVAFFCYAGSVPTTCRLERLRIWELPN